METTIALDSLKDTSTYLNMSYNPLSETTEFIKNKIDELIFTKLISEKLGNLLILGDPVISNFRILPKLHKDTFSIRPIINCINSPTLKICQFLDLVLQYWSKSRPVNFVAFRSSLYWNKVIFL